MSGLRAQIAVRGDVSCMRTLERWAARAGDSEPAMEAISSYMEDQERQLFDTQGASSGSPWVPLAGETLSSKTRLGESSDPLRATDALYDSLTSTGSQYAIREKGPGWLRFGTSRPGSEFLRSGTSKMPARNPLVVTPTMRRVVTRLMAGWITGRVVKGLRPSIRTMRGPWL